MREGSKSIPKNRSERHFNTLKRRGCQGLPFETIVTAKIAILMGKPLKKAFEAPITFLLHGSL
jgi:hypothetical protein